MARLYEKHMTHNYSTSGKGKSHQNIEEGKHSHDDTAGTLRTGDVAIEYLYPLFGSYCCVMSFFPEWPGIAFYIYYYIIIIILYSMLRMRREKHSLLYSTRFNTL